MYAPSVIDASEAWILEHRPAIAALYPDGIPAYSIADSAALTASACTAVDDEGRRVRPLTDDEDRFVAASQLRCTFDFPYFAERFVYIDESGYGLRPLYPLWESQHFLLRTLARLDEQRRLSEYPDGLLVNILKARQLGMSTMAEALVAHRVFLVTYVRALCGADVEAQAAYLFRMVGRIYQQLPWFLKPQRIEPYRADREMSFANQSSLKTAWGKSTRGALQSVSGQEGTKGAIGRGQTYSVVHISELATWDNPDQLDTALFPAIPVAPRTLCVLESTAEYAGDWWHKQWLASADGIGRFTNIFIPWYAEQGKYSLPAAIDWSPAVRTLEHAAKCEADAPKWFDGRTVSLTRDQLFWYEQTRATYERKGILHKFLKEYPADDQECVTGDTRVATDRGLIAIADAQGIHQTECGRVQQWWDRGERPVYTVKTVDGRSFTATADHRVARPDGSWTTVSALQAGDALQLSPPQFLVEDLYVAQWQWAPITTTSLVIDADFARLLGFFLGDGSYGNNCVDIACCLDDPDVIEEVARLLTQTIGHPPIRQRRTLRGLSVRSSSIRWREILWHLGLLDRRSATQAGYKKRVRVPECIWRSPKPIIAAFLQGLFESDGHAHTSGPQTSFFAKDEVFTQEVQLLLLGFGIPSQIRRVVRRRGDKVFPGHMLRLNGASTVRFHAEIGFVGVRKRSTPRHLGGKGRGGRRAAPIAFVDTVASITPAGVQRVYDLGIHDTHCFGANGIKVHNCFQYAGRAIFTLDQLEQIDKAGRRPILDVWAVEPSREIAALKRESLPADPPSKRADPPLSLRIPAATSPHAAATYPVPPGYGFRRLPASDLAALPSLRASVLAIWEYPRARGKRRYILSADVADGLGLDYSVIDVIRQPTIEEPAEQVAQYVSNQIDAKQLAFICDAIGRFYTDEDGIEALAAIETNNHGLSTQDTLQLHLGYGHFYVWEYADSASPDRRYSTKIGWVTSPRTRPLLLSSFHSAITTFDPITAQPDLVLNSPITRGELRHFITETTIGDAAAARGQHDDGVMAAAIGYYVAWRMAGGETEPISERRSRRAALAAEIETREGAGAAGRPDWRNTAVTAAEADRAHEDEDEFSDDTTRPAGDALYFDDRATSDGGS